MAELPALGIVADGATEAEAQEALVELARDAAAHSLPSGASDEVADEVRAADDGELRRLLFGR